MSSLETIAVRSTTREEMIDITRLVRDAIRKLGVQSGIACVFVPHTTCALTLQENTDPNVKTDMMAHLRKLVPRDAGFTNEEENTDAHIKSTLVGASVTAPVEAGKPLLGHWQALFLCEFDGPRDRKVHVRVLG
jgi:secondary thiamine-phosphate synthase enzyme